MPDEDALTQALKALLQTIPGLETNVYVGTVPEKLPMDGVYIRPYVVIFAGIGSDLPEERDLSLLADTTVVDWAPQTTVVGASATACQQLARAVKEKLTNRYLGTGWLLPDADAFRVAKPITDSQVTPARAFMPLNWRLLTN